MKLLKNNKGQALVEFVLILPLILIIFTASVDAFNFFYGKIKLENSINEINVLINKGVTINEIKKDYSNFTTYYDGDYLILCLQDNIKIYTPVLSNVLSNPYLIKTERKILYE